MIAVLMRKDWKCAQASVAYACVVVAACAALAMLVGLAPELAKALWRGGNTPTLAERLLLPLGAAGVACGVVPYVAAVLVCLGDSMRGAQQLASILPASTLAKTACKLVVILAVCALCAGVYGVIAAALHWLDAHRALSAWPVAMCALTLASALAGVAATAIYRSFTRCLLVAALPVAVCLVVGTLAGWLVMSVCAAVEGRDASLNAYAEAARLASVVSSSAGWIAMCATLAVGALPFMAGVKSQTRPLAALLAATGVAIAVALGTATVVAIAPPDRLADLRRVEELRGFAKARVAKLNIRELVSAAGKIQQFTPDEWRVLRHLSSYGFDPWSMRSIFVHEGQSGWHEDATDIHAAAVNARAVEFVFNENGRRHWVEELRRSAGRPLGERLVAARYLPMEDQALLISDWLPSATEGQQIMLVAALASLRAGAGTADRITWCEAVNRARSALHFALDPKSQIPNYPDSLVREFNSEQRRSLTHAIALVGAPHPRIAELAQTMGSAMSATELACIRNGVPE